MGIPDFQKLDKWEDTDWTHWVVVCDVRKPQHTE
jgi:hypothetical protein